MIVAIWGANGSGKTTLTAQIGCEVAKDSLTLLVGGALTHSSLQHHLGLSENEKTLKNVMQNPESVRDNVCNYSKRKDLFVLDLGAKDDCLQQADLTDNQALRVLEIADNIFDIVIVDCSVNYNNSLTRAALLQACTVLHIFQPTLEGISFTLSHRVLVDRLGLASKTKYILNQDQKMIDYMTLKKLIGTDIAAKLPYCNSVLKSSITGVPLSIVGPSSKLDNRYLNRLRELVRKVVSEREVV